MWQNRRMKRREKRYANSNNDNVAGCDYYQRGSHNLHAQDLTQNYVVYEGDEDENQTLLINLYHQRKNLCRGVDNDKSYKEKSMVFMEETRRDTGRETGAGTTAPLKDYLVAIKS